jgi:methylmalonyl-CoA/ethylmalonyl-CoA epimerase
MHAGSNNVLDHVAHAVHHWREVWQRYAVDLGARWSSGGLSTGFAPGQIEFGNGSRLEMLMPNDTAANDFLDRFLTGNGPGPHHLTFKVPDLDQVLERTVAAGYAPIGIDRSDQEWMEAFLHPKQATGIVVQMAQAANPWTSPPPDGYPSGRRQRRDGSGPVPPATLVRVVHAVADIGEGTALFGGLLGGTVTAEGTDDGLRWVELSWGGPLDMRLIAPANRTPGPLDDWLGGRSGRLHHLVLAAEEADALPGARPWTGPTVGTTGTGRRYGVEIAPAENEGLRLVVGLPER